MRNKFFRKAVVNTIIIALVFCSVVVPFSWSTSYAATGEKKVTVMLTGDLMCDYKFQDDLYNKGTGKFNFDNTFRFVRHWFKRADIVVGNLEGNCSSKHPLSRKRHTYRGKPYLNGPPSYLKALKKAGFDGVVMANNHNCDTYKSGIKKTVRAVDKAGLKHAGLYSSSKDKHYFIIKRNGVKVAFLSYAIYFNGLEGTLSKKSRDRMLSVYSREKATKEIGEARKAGADFVIVYIHMGKEYSHKVRDYQKTIMKSIAKAGADYIVGSHAHVLQRAGVIECEGKEVHCVYGMGNFTGKLTDKATRESAILKLTLKKKADGQTVLSHEKIIPCYMVDKSRYGKLVVIPKGAKVKGKALNASLKRHYRKSEKYVKIGK